MDNEITINGEVYVKKAGLFIEVGENKYPVVNLRGTLERQEKPWPQEGDEVFYVNGFGDVIKHYSWKNNSETKDLMNRGNFFQTQEEAQMYSLRIESLSKGFMPKEDEIFFYWDFDDNGPNEDFRPRIALLYPKFPTKEECQEWYDSYGASWLALLNDKK